MIGIGDGHKCYKVRVYVKPNIDQEYYVVAKDIANAMLGATEALNSQRGYQLQPEMCVTEVIKTGLIIWIDRDNLG